MKTLDKSALANEQFRALSAQQLVKELIYSGHQENGKEVKVLKERTEKHR